MITQLFVTLLTFASPTVGREGCFNIADHDERGNYIEACEVTSSQTPSGIREFDVTWCIESEYYNECGGTERPWGCDLTQGDDITVCILTQLDGACCGCISGCPCDEDCGEEESPPVPSTLDLLTSQVGPVGDECESWNDGVHCGASCDAGEIICGFKPGRGSLCLAYGPDGDVIGRVDLPGNICADPPSDDAEDMFFKIAQSPTASCREVEPIVIEDAFGNPVFKVPGSGYEECCDGGTCCRNTDAGVYTCD